MGNYIIRIEGCGAHHNSHYPDDAEKLATEFVQYLRAKGHYINQATFTPIGSTENINLPKPESQSPGAAPHIKPYTITNAQGDPSHG